MLLFELRAFFAAQEIFGLHFLPINPRTKYRFWYFIILSWIEWCFSYRNMSKRGRDLLHMLVWSVWKWYLTQRPEKWTSNALVYRHAHSHRSDHFYFVKWVFFLLLSTIWLISHEIFKWIFTKNNLKKRVYLSQFHCVSPKKKIVVYFKIIIL